MRSWVIALVMLAWLGSTERARAGGYDTPILYTARHLGMGGTAIGYVDDASAVYHNPAGLQSVRFFNAVGDFSLLLGHAKGSPAAGANARSIESELTVGPYFLIGAAYRLHPWITLGAGFFPVATAGATYKYDSAAGAPIEDETRLVFFEATPAVSINVPRDQWVPGLLSLGVGYRIDIVDFTRTQTVGSTDQIDLKLSGVRATGARIGLQWKPSDQVSVGAVFRNKVTVKTSDDSGTAFGLPATNPELSFVLPAKLGAGARYDIAAFGFAADFEYGFYSQNKAQPVSAEVAGQPMQVANVFDWHNAITLRGGVEYRLGANQNIPIRVGYVYDGQVANVRFPTPFGTPPTPTHSFTAGAGLVLDPLRFDVAYAHRFGSRTVSRSDLAPSSECPLCGLAGQYAITINGLYFDVVLDLPK